MSKKPVIAYLSSADPLDKKVWSGTHYSIYRTLAQVADVKVLGPYIPKTTLLFGALLNQIILKLSGKRFDYRHSRFVAKVYGRYFSKQLKTIKPDLIIAPAASTELAYAVTNAPVIYLTDGTFAGCLNYHKVLSNLTNFSSKQGNAIEQAAISKSKFVVVSSPWAAKSVIEDYGKNKAEVVVVPYGANFEQIIPNDFSYKAGTVFKLLFVGVYWQSKGGDIAYRAYKLLRDKGLSVSLTIMGCEPPQECMTEGVTVVPFIDKNSKDGQAKMQKIYAEHHLLLLPTRFDCTPIVINEASAFGLPCLVADTGGVAGHLREGQNGYLLPYNDTGAGYAGKIEQLMLAPEQYNTLRASAEALYKAELNWQHWLEKMKPLIADCGVRNI